MDKSEIKEHIEGRKDLIRALVLCLLAVVVVRSFLFEPFKIPSSSMLPTLKIGDHIFVSKFNFGLSIPFTKLEFLKWGQPQRGDVIVFLFPRDESLHYIKRVIGLPGDKIEFRGKEILVNDQLIPKELVTDQSIVQSVLEDASPSDFEVYRETIGETVHFVRYRAAESYNLTRANFVDTVPADSFFVAGDNRDDSYDSRSWGNVQRENIKGKAQIVWLSLNPDAAWGSLDKIRWKRCGTLIH